MTAGNSHQVDNIVNVNLSYLSHNVNTLKFNVFALNFNVNTFVSHIIEL